MPPVRPVRTLLAFLFPDCCLSCGAPLEATRAHLCADCALGLIPRPGSIVLPVPPDVDRPPLEPVLTFYAFEFEGPARALVHALKYEGRTSLARDLAALATTYVRAACGGDPPDAVAHVPLHAVKRRERGFNQGELLATHIATALEAPHVRALERVAAGDSQAGSDRRLRLRMRSDAFRGRGPRRERSRGRDGESLRRVLLVDDVVTTGATMAAASHALLGAGFKDVVCFAVAATRRNGPQNGRKRLTGPVPATRMPSSNGNAKPRATQAERGGSHEGRGPHRRRRLPRTQRCHQGHRSSDDG